jgi:hypothetical protein
MAQPPTPPFTPQPPGQARPGIQASPLPAPGVDADYVGIDTGLGGVVIGPGDVNNSKPGIYSYIVGDPARQQDPDLPFDLSLRGGNVNVDHTPKDLSKDTKRTLADYLGKKTEVNRYPVDGVSSIVETRITGENNTTPQIQPPGATNSNYHTRDAGNLSGVNLQSPDSPLRGWVTTAATSDTPEALLKDVVKKGKSQVESRDAQTGDSLLKDEPKQAMTRYQNAILANNRFASISDRSQTFSGEGKKKKKTKVEQDGVSVVNVETEDDVRFNPTFHHPRYGAITAGRLAQIGTALSLRATGESVVSSQAANDPAVVQKSWLAKQARGQTVDLVDLELEEIIKEISELDLKDEFYLNVTNDASWGNVNNVINTFTSTSMLALASVMSNVVVEIIQEVYQILLLIFGKESLLPTTSRKKFGSSQEINPVMNLLGIPPTQFSLAEAVVRGTSLIFESALGLGGLTDSVDSLSEIAINGISGVAQVVFYIKMIIVSGIKLIKQVIGLFSLNLIGSPSESLYKMKNLIEELSNSKLMAAIRIAAIKGDYDLATRYYFQEQSAAEQASAGIPRIHLPRVIDKFGNVTNRLSMGTSRAIATLLLPRNIEEFVGNVATQMDTPQVKLLDDLSRVKYIRPISGRIPNGDDVPPKSLDDVTVSFVERRLDAEYVPFYFHDLRTNEIVSFHAFLESLSDDFSTAYESIEGIGRIEPVRIYKGTQRKIGISFVVVSTNESDYQFMWEKINKMTTLMYPQYTQGRRHNVGTNYSFIQPFSQLVGATPLIRLRLGDLIKSNYSKFALARLFGANLPESRFDKEAEVTETSQETTNEPPKQTTSNPNTLLAEAKKKYEDTGEKIFNLSTGQIVVRSRRLEGEWLAPGLTSDVYSPSILRSSGDLNFFKERPSFNVPIERVKRFQFDASQQGVPTSAKKGVIQQGEWLWAFTIPWANKALWKKEGYVLTSEQEAIRKKNEDLEKSFPNPPVYILFERDLWISGLTPRAQKLMTPEARNKARIEGLGSFLDEKNNAIVKSFKSASGKGLAGVIESMNFDWLTYTWETNGSVAPKACKITISFSPIHDISPGLDSQGYNRAPIYSVVPMNKQVEISDSKQED